jgi:hypothetical protein
MKKIACIFILSVFILFPNNILFADEEEGGIIITKQTYDGSDIVVFNVSVKNFPKTIDSLGLDIKYDVSTLKFTGYGKGELVQAFDFFNVTNNQDSAVVRIGGFEAGGDRILKGATGTIAQLSFELIGTAEYDTVQTNFANLKDDLNPLLLNEDEEKNQEQSEDGTENQPDTDDSEDTDVGSLTANAELDSDFDSKNTEENDPTNQEETLVDTADPDVADTADTGHHELHQDDINDTVDNLKKRSASGFEIAKETIETIPEYSDKYSDADSTSKTGKQKKTKTARQNKKTKTPKEKVKNKKAPAASLQKDNKYISDLISCIMQTNASIEKNNILMQKLMRENKNIKKDSLETKNMILVLALIHGIAVSVFILKKIMDFVKRIRKRGW